MLFCNDIIAKCAIIENINYFKYSLLQYKTIKYKHFVRVIEVIVSSHCNWSSHTSHARDNSQSLLSQHILFLHTFNLNHFIITNYCYSKCILTETFLLINNMSLRFTLSSWRTFIQNFETLKNLFVSSWRDVFSDFPLFFILIKNLLILLLYKLFDLNKT